MKANEIMINDYVYNTYNEKNEKVTVIGSVLVGLSNNKLYEYDDIAPIQLTKNIIEKICDKVDPIEGNIHNYVEYHFGEDILISSEDDMPFMLYFENTPGEHVYVKIEYFHELQHWLKLLKYEKEIEL